MKVQSSDRKRLSIVAVFLCILFCQLIVRFYTIQIIEGDKWAAAATLQHQYLVTESCMRGSFYSNTDVKKGHPGDVQPFVVDVPKFHLFIDPDTCLLYTSPSPRDRTRSRMPSSA